MRTIQTTVYTFEELSEQAKEKAREWYRSGAFDYDWFDFVYEDAATIAEMFGLDICTQRVQLKDGSHRYDPSIFFSGFWSQGDGACFAGSYQYKKGALKAVRQHAPNDKRLHEIVSTLQQLQRVNFYQVTCKTKHYGHYYHSGCMSVECERADGRDVINEYDFRVCMRDFADWIYNQLEKEYEWLNSDEQVDESIITNEYEFDEEGNIQ